MEKQIIKQTLLDQKEELLNTEKKGKILERHNIKSYKEQLNSALIKVIIGIRRCGKSTLAFQLLKDKNFAYANFDDERLASLNIDDLNKVLEVLYEIYGKFDFILLDEIQNIPGWELFTNRLQRQGLNVIITGSNAKLLSKELATHLTGRHLSIDLFPFSFKEFLTYNNIPHNPLSTREIGTIKNYLNNYIENGGFPETLKETTPKKEYLQTLYSTIITKDVILRHKIKFSATLKNIASYLLTVHSSLVSFNKIKNIFSIKSVHTSLNYVSFLEEAYLFFFLRRLTSKHKESLIANRKVYCIDTGLINALGFKTSKDIGKLYENIVAVELIRRKSMLNSEVYYWQDYQQNEVDFVIKKSLHIEQLIQVCYDSNIYKTKNREITALLKASKELNCDNLLIITYDKDKEEIVEDKKIIYIPLWKWLIEE